MCSVKEFAVMACEQVVSCNTKPNNVSVKLYSGELNEFYVTKDIAEELIHSMSGLAYYSSVCKDTGRLHRELAKFSDMRRQFEMYLRDKVGLRFSKDIEAEVEVIFKQATIMFCYEVEL